MSINWGNYPYKATGEIDSNDNFGMFFHASFKGSMTIGYSKDFKSIACKLTFGNCSIYNMKNPNSAGFYNVVCFGWNSSSEMLVPPDTTSKTFYQPGLDLVNVTDNSSKAFNDINEFLSPYQKSQIICAVTQADNSDNSAVISLRQDTGNPSGKTIEKTWSFESPLINPNGKPKTVYPLYFATRFYDGDIPSSACWYRTIEGFPQVANLNWKYFPYARSLGNGTWRSCNAPGSDTMNAGSFQRHNGTKWIDRKNNLFGDDDTAFRYYNYNQAEPLPITGTE